MHLKNDERISKPSKVCGDHGVKEGSTCTCQPGWVGDLCQYKTNCESDDDCNKVEPPRLRHLRWGIVSATFVLLQGHGECIVVDNAVYRQGECFCSEGWQVLTSLQLIFPEDQSLTSQLDIFDLTCWPIYFGNFLMGNPGQQL